MSAESNIQIVGNLTRDPELRFTPAGMPVANFGVAVNHRRKKGEEWEESTSFFDVVCWGTLGENVSESVTKGTRVQVVGRLEQRTWEDKEGGKRSTIEVIADEVGPSLRWATAQVTKKPSENQGNGRTTAPSGSRRAAPAGSQTY